MNKTFVRIVLIILIVVFIVGMVVPFALMR